MMNYCTIERIESCSDCGTPIHNGQALYLTSRGPVHLVCSKVREVADVELR